MIFQNFGFRLQKIIHFFIYYIFLYYSCFHFFINIFLIINISSLDNSVFSIKSKMNFSSFIYLASNMSSSSIGKSSKFCFSWNYVFSGPKSVALSRTISFFYHFPSLLLNLPYRIEGKYLSNHLSFFLPSFSISIRFWVAGSSYSKLSFSMENQHPL